MSVPSGRLQFFALEAGDYLERLALIVGRPEPPEPDELIRLTRALRGASLMAGLAPFSHAAAGLEQIAKAHRAGQWSWSPGQTELVADAIEQLKRLTRSAAEWGEPDTAAANRLTDQLTLELGREGIAPAVRPARPPSDELQASVRAFVGQEGAMIAGTLEHAAQAIELGQGAETAEVVLQRMQPLRGLAALPSLSPLPELLDAVELTMRVVRDTAPPPLAPQALRQAAAAITRVAREIADKAKATADAPETVTAARALLAAFGAEDDVVEIRQLFLSSDASPIVRRGAVPAREAGDPMIELVSLSDRLRQSAEQLGQTSGATARALQLFALVTELRPVARRDGGRSAMVPLLSAIMRAVTTGRAEAAPDRFADLLRETARRLGAIAEARNAIFLADEVADLVSSFGLADVVPAPAEPVREPIVEPAVEPVIKRSVVPAVSFDVTTATVIEVGDDSPIVPIESLFFDEPVPIESLAPDPEPVGPRSNEFERSFSTYHRLRHPEAAPAGPEPIAAAGPIVRTPPTRPPLAPSAPQRPADLDDVAVVPIGTLLYRGRRALERADVVRLELTDALDHHLTFDQVEPLVSELIDLVPLALAE